MPKTDPPSPRQLNRQLDGYQRLAERTIGDSRPEILALGLTGEAGEVADHLKKVLGHGHPMDVDDLEGELGDVLWYIAALASYHDIPLSRIAERNICKLEARYPDGFSTEASIARKDKPQP